MFETDMTTHDALPLDTASGEHRLPSLHELERSYIERVLRETGGHQRRAAQILGITRWSLARRLRKYGLVSGEGEGDTTKS
jgi:DNA-binding NtrC family response regulator